MAFLHGPRIKVLGTRGHMVRLRRGPLLFNFRANHMEFKNFKTASCATYQAEPQQQAADKQQQTRDQDKTTAGRFLGHAVSEGELRNPAAQQDGQR